MNNKKNFFCPHCKEIICIESYQSFKIKIPFSNVFKKRGGPNHSREDANSSQTQPSHHQQQQQQQPPVDPAISVQTPPPPPPPVKPLPPPQQAPQPQLPIPYHYPMVSYGQHMYQPLPMQNQQHPPHLHYPNPPQPYWLTCNYVTNTTNTTTTTNAISTPTTSTMGGYYQPGFPHYNQN